MAGDRSPPPRLGFGADSHACSCFQAIPAIDEKEAGLTAPPPLNQVKLPWFYASGENTVAERSCSQFERRFTFERRSVRAEFQA